MPPRRNIPTLGQDSLPGIADAVPIHRDLDSRNSFARMATPDYWGLDPVKYGDITPTMIDRMSPDYIRPSLIDVHADSECAVSYIDDITGQKVNIAVTPHEYGILARNIAKLGEASVNQTLAARPSMPNFAIHDAAAERSGVHTLEGYVTRMQEYADGTLNADIQKLRRFKEAADHPGLGRGKEIDMRLDMQWVMDHIIGDTLLALRRQRNWTPEQADLASRSLQARLFFDRAGNKHLSNWREMIIFELEYTSHKLALFKDRTRQAKSYIRNHANSSS